MLTPPPIPPQLRWCPAGLGWHASARPWSARVRPDGLGGWSWRSWTGCGPDEFDWAGTAATAEGAMGDAGRAMRGDGS